MLQTLYKQKKAYKHKDGLTVLGLQAQYLLSKNHLASLYQLDEVPEIRGKFGSK